MILPTDEEMSMIKEYILLPLVVTVFDRDKKIIEEVELKTKEPYIAFFDRTIASLNNEILIIRREFRKRGIKVLEVKRNKKHLSCCYLCRGYQGDFVMMMYGVKHEVVKKMRRCLGEFTIDSNVRDTL